MEQTEQSNLQIVTNKMSWNKMEQNGTNSVFSAYFGTNGTNNENQGTLK